MCFVKIACFIIQNIFKHLFVLICIFINLPQWMVKMFKCVIKNIYILAYFEFILFLYPTIITHIEKREREREREKIQLKFLTT